MKLLQKITGAAPGIPTTMITIFSGFAGMLLPGPGGFSALDALLAGDWKGLSSAASYNYVGVNTSGRGNSLGQMIRRCKGTHVAILGQILKGLYLDMRD